MLAVYLILFLTTIYVFYHLARKPRIQQNGKSLPRPGDTLPLLGNAITFLQPRDTLYNWFVGCQKHFGLDTYQISVPTLPPGVVINDPKNLEFILQNELLFHKGDLFRTRSWDLFGDGIINSDGDFWKAQRKAGLQFFSGTSIDTLIEVELPRQYGKIHSRLLKAARNGEIIDLQDVLFDLTTSTMGRMAYAMDIDASSTFAKAFDYASGKTGDRFQNPLWWLTELFTGGQFRAALHEVHDFGSKIVSEAESRLLDTRATANSFQELRTSRDQSLEVEGTLISSLLRKFPDRKVVADSALNLLSAARDTTAQSLTWTFYCLMRNPDVIGRIQSEITDSNLFVMATLNTASLQPQNLPYLHAAFNEALRLYPPIPFEIKQCADDAILPDETFLPAGSVILWCIWSMNRSEEIWDSKKGNLTSYVPDRWLEYPSTTENADRNTNSDGKTKVHDVLSRPRLQPKSPFEFPVFNAGPRACLGRKMAELMGVWVMVKVIQDFELIECEDYTVDARTAADTVGIGDNLPERRTKNSLTLPMEGGLPCRVKKRVERAMDGVDP